MLKDALLLDEIQSKTVRCETLNLSFLKSADGFSPERIKQEKKKKERKGKERKKKKKTNKITGQSGPTKLRQSFQIGGKKNNNASDFRRQQM